MSFKPLRYRTGSTPFGLDHNDVLSTDGNTAKPSLILPVNQKLSENEILAAKQWIAFAELIRDGPFNTGALDEASKGRTNVAPDGIERHSDKYRKVKKIGRTIEEHPYQLDFFPTELYSVMGVSKKEKKKLLSLSTFKADGGLADFSSNHGGQNGALATLEKLRDLTEELDFSQLENVGKGDDVEDEEVDDDFEDEEDDDEDDDYNAEKYFDGGDDDIGDDDDDEAAF